MQYIQKFSIYFLAISLLLAGCKKDSDDFGPKITINAPFENQGFSVYDDIYITGNATDETKVMKINISLVDANYNAVHKTIPVILSSTSSQSLAFNAYYLLDNIHLESGLYFLKISASDGKNDSKTYRQLFITAVPKAVQQVFITSYATTSQTNLYTINGSFSGLTLFHSFSGDYSGSSVSGYYQQATMCGRSTGALTSVKISNNSINYNVPAVISSNPYFTGFYADDQKTYIARYDGYIRCYDHSGNVINGAMSNTGYCAQQMCLNDNFIVAEEREKITGAKILVTFFENGSPQQQCSLAQDVIAFCEKDDFNIFIFGNNSSGQGVLQLFDRINNFIWNPYPSALPVGAILSAVKIDNDTYLIGHSNGTIYKYQFASSSITPYLTGYTAVKLKYDFINNEVYVAEDFRITSFDYSSAVLNNSVISAEAITDINLLYNR